MDDKVTNLDPPKRWVVCAKAAPRQPMTIACDGRPLTQSALGSLDNISPVEYLLISIAGCFALSCLGALKARKMPPTAVEVMVTGEKARDSPSRVGRIALAATFAQGLSDQEAVDVANDAKKLCTVTNTIFGVPDVEVVACSMS